MNDQSTVCSDQRWGRVFPDDVLEGDEEEFLAHSKACPFHSALIDLDSKEVGELIRAARDKYPAGTPDELVGGIRNSADFKLVLPKPRK